MAADGAPPATGKPHVGTRQVRQATLWGKRKYAGSAAESLWRRLDTVDFMNQAMLFAATLLLCAFPFFLVLTALTGRSAANAVTHRLGLNQQAAADVSHLITSKAATSAAVTGLAWLFFVLAGLAFAASVQGLYQRIFDLSPRGARDMPRQVIWLALVAGYLFLIIWATRWTSRAGPFVLAVFGLVTFTGVWWFTMWFLLAGRIPWRRLFPPALVTGLFMVGMLAVFSVIFSGMVISYTDKYGPIGTVLALMSWMIAFGVVILLGSAVGLVWQERRAGDSPN